MENNYSVIKSRYVTEKAKLTERLQEMKSNPSLAKFDQAKYVFLVDMKATKCEIAKAIEAIYAEKQIRVTAVNTLRVKPKRRRVRGHSGFKSAFKKAIVTLKQGDRIE